MGGAPVTLASGVATAARGSAVATLSASGSLAFVGGRQMSGLVVAGPTGEAPFSTNDAAYAQPRFSPDGRRIAVTIATGTRSDIWLGDVASGNLMQLTSGGTVNERPEWSPDGKRVLFRTLRSSRSALWWQSADASGPAEPLMANDSADYYEGVLTPDGRTVVYQVDTSGPDVMIQAITGTESSRPIAHSSALEDQARVSPNGRWVAYVTTESGNPQVMVQPLPGPGGRVQISIHSGSEPVWTRDGRRIFYRAENKFKVAEVAETPSFHVTARRDFMDDTYLPQAVPHANYDVTPDGTSLLVLKGEQQRLLVVYNWAMEARSKLLAATAH